LVGGAHYIAPASLALWPFPAITAVTAVTQNGQVMRFKRLLRSLRLAAGMTRVIPTSSTAIPIAKLIGLIVAARSSSCRRSIRPRP
jgi:hypothetical protein